MKALIVFDSYFGNTEKISRSIGEGLGSKDIKIARVGDVKSDDFNGIEVLIVGSPTRAFRPTKAVVSFVNNIPRDGLKGVKVTAFDTGITKEDTSVKILKIMIGFFGYAAKPIAERLKTKGGELVIEPEGFFVLDTKGPLKKGEEDRAKEWAKEISKKAEK